MASFTERYHELTKYNPTTIDKLGAVNWNEQPYPFKLYPDSKSIDLRNHLTDYQDPFSHFFASENKFSLKLLSHLLYYTCGITAKIIAEEGDHYLRANPSAGGLYPTEVYVQIKNTPEIPEGLYHFNPAQLSISKLPDGSKGLKDCFIDPEEGEADWLFFFTGIYARSAWRYKERAYRRILLDTGHLVGNLLELCNTWDLNARLFTGFYDKQLEEYLQLKTHQETPLLGLSLSQNPESQRKPFVYRSSSPEEAIKKVISSNPLLIQQNTCERIWKESPTQLVETEEGALGKFRSFQLRSIEKSISQRRSCREYQPVAISKEKLNQLLEYSYHSYSHVHGSLIGRCLKTWVLLLNVEGMDQGIYQLNNQTLQLEQTLSGNMIQESLEIGLEQPLAGTGAFNLIHTVHLPELIKKYGDRGYRYACIEAGMIGEKINLIAEELELGASGIGGYYDDLANKYLELPLEEAILYITTVGTPRSGE